MVRLKAGDERAFEKLVERYQSKVFMIAYSILKNEDDAYDATQDAFLKVYKYIGNFRETSSLYTWLYKIAYHVSIDIYRKRKKMGATEYLDYMDSNQDMDTLHHVVRSPSSYASNNELAKSIEESLDKLSDQHREIIILREMEGLSYSEISEILGISSGTVMSRIHHARLNLQKYLKEHL